MDYETFYNDENASDADYFGFVQWLSRRTAAELRQAKGDPQELRNVLCRYYKRGQRSNLTPGELIDLLGVGTPSILDIAGFTDEEADAIMAVSDNLKDDEINQAPLW